MKHIILIVLVLLAVGNLSSQDLERFGMKGDTAPTGLKIGSQAPNFTATDQNGNNIELESQLKKGPVVLVFYRGAWCPYCVRYLQNITDSLSHIQQAGATVYAVTPQLDEGIVMVSEKIDNQIAILHDKNGDIMDAYDGSFEVTEKYQERVSKKKMSLAESNGQEIAALPVPATYVISETGMVIYRHFDYDYKTRSTVAAILSAIVSK